MNEPILSGERLRLARAALGLTLEQLGERVGASRQYLNQIEKEQKSPTMEMIEALSAALIVDRSFLCSRPALEVSAERCHFRKQRTTPISVAAQVTARATVFAEFLRRIDTEVSLPPVSIPTIAVETTRDIEEAAEQARSIWRLGTGPISNMTRVAENAGAVVTFFGGVSERVDALSIDLDRPLIVRNEAKPAACRMRFDIAHEVGHLIMHRGLQTGDKFTEGQANRFASAFLLPRGAFIHEFPRSRFLSWEGIFEMKLKWKVSAAAILRRAYDLRLIDADQYRTGNIHLTKTGQRKKERFDDILKLEEPELVSSALAAIEEVSIGSAERLALSVGMKGSFLSAVADLNISEVPDQKNVAVLRRIEGS